MKDQLIENIENKLIVFHNHVKLTNGIYKDILVDMKKQFYIELNHETYNLLIMAKDETIAQCLKTLGNNDKNKFIDFIIIDLRSFNNKRQPEDYITIINRYDFSSCLIEVYDFFPSVDEIDCYLVLRMKYNLFIKYKKKIIKYSNFINEVHIYDSPDKHRAIIKSTRLIYDTSDNLSINCGIVSQYWFCLSSYVYDFSKKYNNCLFGKIYIDAEGNIKNCPSMKESFGNIKDTTLEEALNKPGFKKYWNIKKDDIIKCKDCEFRYICTDCRAYLEDPHDIYSAPLKCGYDPYTGKWEEWSKNPLKAKAIRYYGMEELLQE